MEFKNVPNTYRPIPFWSWNEKLNTEETARQIRIMNEAGIGGFVMHARGGLQTEYMGNEWFENISCSVDSSKQYKMNAWAYDENGWPSGYGNGRVNGKGIKYQQKYLRIEKGEKETAETICNVDGFHFYYDINPYYVDVLDEEVIGDFIQEIYEPYYERYQQKIKGFFTDEPQISRDGIPWSFKLPKAYRDKYGEDLLPHLKKLFYAEGNYREIRIKFWKLVCDMFSENCMKQIYEWCNSKGLELTGHLVLEESLIDQLTCNAACMPHYEYFHIPGMDWLGRPIFDCLTVHQVASVAQQLGKKQVLAETFALCGHNVGFEQLKRIYEWQMVRGANLLCQHLEGYSLRGIRKRDYPPAMYYQQPWWSEYRQFVDSVSRIGMMLTEGEVECDTLLIHPQTTAWAMFDNEKNEGIAELNQLLLDTISVMEQKHISFHLGDETIMERHAKVEGDTLCVGCMRYDKIIVLPGTILLENTKKLLDEYKTNGGVFAEVKDLHPEDIIDNPYITYTKRKLDNCFMYYFVNSTDDVQKANIKNGSKVMDITTGGLSDFYGKYEFAPFESLVVIDDGEERKEPKEKQPPEEITAEGVWQIVEQSPNVLTLDMCRYFFDGELIEENGYVLNIQNRACELQRPVSIRQEFTVLADIIPEDLFLVIETPQIFKITINGKEIEYKDEGYFMDSSFRKISISKCFKNGENTIVLETLFKQSEAVYDNLKKAFVFESEKNRLTYDMEIEPIYLIGEFGVSTNGKMKKTERDAFWYNGDFKLTKPTETVELKNIEKQGFPFFAGTLKVEKTMYVTDKNKKLVFNKKGINAICVEVNGKQAGKVLWTPTEVDLSEFLVEGENKVRLTLINNLRNMLGPHHLKDGESFLVDPGAFFKEACVWCLESYGWNEEYCFVETGLI